MAKPDKAHRLTEKKLAELERRIARIYEEARKDLEKTIADYFDHLVERDKKQKELLKAGKITEEHYKQWRLNQIGRGKRFEHLRDQMAERYTQANEIAMEYINDELPGIYALNRSYSAYIIDMATGGALTLPMGTMEASWTLHDEATIRRLIKKRPDLMPFYPPEKAVDRKIDLAWGKRKITEVVTSGILQGQSIPKIADVLQSQLRDMERSSAIRAARTAVTSAQNGGRQSTYHIARNMGIPVKKRWLATLDGRTRMSHRRLDGEIIEIDGEYSNGCKYPGDPNGPPHEIYNCRCTEIAVIEGIDTSSAKRAYTDPQTGKTEYINSMTYTEWEKWLSGR